LLCTLTACQHVTLCACGVPWMQCHPSKPSPHTPHFLTSEAHRHMNVPPSATPWHTVNMCACQLPSCISHPLQMTQLVTMGHSASYHTRPPASCSAARVEFSAFHLNRQRRVQALPHTMPGGVVHTAAEACLLLPHSAGVGGTPPPAGKPSAGCCCCSLLGF
jgi:hypothetical protein